MASLFVKFLSIAINSSRENNLDPLISLTRKMRASINFVVPCNVSIKKEDMSLGETATYFTSDHFDTSKNLPLRYSKRSS